MPGRVASVLLAAGAATRFGGRKQLALLDGKPLLAHALAIAAASDTDLTVVVLGAYAEEIEAAVDLGDADVVRCPDWELGRAASLRAGLAALPADVEAALITLGDEPYVSPAAAARLLAARRRGLAALRASYAGRPGHPVLVERELFAELQEPPAGRKPGRTLRAAGALLVPCDDLGTPVDIDTPAQLAELTAHPPAPQSGRPSSTSE
jgi:CTP:molybdopterin cytidylyltransferase MocA